MACANECDGEVPRERPRLAASPQVRASALAWIFIGAGICAHLAGAPRLEVAAFAAAILVGSFYFAREAFEELWREHEVGIELLMTVAIASIATS